MVVKPLAFFVVVFFFFFFLFFAFFLKVTKMDLTCSCTNPFDYFMSVYFIDQTDNLSAKLD